MSEQSSLSLLAHFRQLEDPRGCWVFGEPTWIRDRSLWVDLRSVVVVVRTRDVDGKSSSEWHYYISSRQTRAADFLQATREHWQIENNCHWVLDVSFAEDQSRIRKDHGAENFSWLRRIALSLLKRVCNRSPHFGPGAILWAPSVVG